MGIDHNTLKCILWASRHEVSFDKVLTIGRQGLHLPEIMLSRTLKLFGMDKGAENASSMISESGFAEPLFRLLGAHTVDSIDFSDFESATIVHDMNLPAGSTRRNSYSVVIDSGSLEHIFNFPCAVKNCMEAVRVGGHLIMITPANNFMGHGFYQFSPELLYRIFSHENGFKVVKMLLFESKLKADFFEVFDPALLKTRVTLVNSVPTYMFVVAKKNDDTQVFSKFPQQSDWVSTWENSMAGRSLNNVELREKGFLSGLVKKILPSSLIKWIRNLRDEKYFLAGMNRDMFSEKSGIKKFDLLR